MSAGNPIGFINKGAGKLVTCFCLSAAALLLITGVAKIVSALGTSPILANPDPIFGIRLNYLLLSVGLIEMAIACFCLPRTTRSLGLVLVAVISLQFLGYRIGLWLTDWRGYCSCLGSLTEAIHLSQRHADLLSQAILAYLLLGSIFLLARNRKRRTNPGSADGIPDTVVG